MEIVQKKASFINCFKKIILLFPLKSLHVKRANYFKVNQSNSTIVCVYLYMYLCTYDRNLKKKTYKVCLGTSQVLMFKSFTITSC